MKIKDQKNCACRTALQKEMIGAKGYPHCYSCQKCKQPVHCGTCKKYYSKSLSTRIIK